MASKSSISLNLKQNSQDFALDFNTQPNIFRLGYFSKVLDPLLRSVPHCNKTWKNLRVNESTSNLFTHYKHSHKAVNLRFLSDNNITLDDSVNTQVTNSQLSIEESFNRCYGRGTGGRQRVVFALKVRTNRIPLALPAMMPRSLRPLWYGP
ncbi:uncharacterized protein RAG0_17545 [Rhynchosporium agropyri]|uniref:Uncharacterized protein n=1 Tax=Rhynchosporium agropyri TaxID=914238 RepID=A0A1E1LU12_9HELO|nr:uncharacterized protein RAG0_17545 [Rhynchosporium agropyri]